MPMAGVAGNTGRDEVVLLAYIPHSPAPLRLYIASAHGPVVHVPTARAGGALVYAQADAAVPAVAKAVRIIASLKHPLC